MQRCRLIGKLLIADCGLRIADLFLDVRSMMKYVLFNRSTHFL